MKLGTEDKKKLFTAIAAGAGALGALIYLYVELFGGPSAPPAQVAPVIINGNKTTISAPAATGKAVASPPGFAVASKVGSTSGELDPTLHMEAMHITESLVYSGSGRNIFVAGSVAPTPTKIADVKPNFIARPQVAQQATPPPLPCPPACPPPPLINLKFFGTSTDSQGIRKAFLLQGDDVFLASTGDVVQRKYRVISIAPTTVLIEDIPNSNKQTLPIIPN